MSSTLNLYATRAFEEHPSSLWALDEPIGYLNLGGGDFHDLGMWSVYGASPIVTPDALAVELPEVPNYNFSFSPSSYLGSGGDIILTSPTTVQEADVNQSLGSIAIGFYVYAPDRSIETRVGLAYTNDQGQQEIIRATRVDPVVDVPARSRKMWAFVSFTFELPESFTDLYPFIEIAYAESAIPFEVSFFGLTFGQWSEEFQSTSEGVDAQELPAEIPISNPEDLEVVEAKPYGLQGQSGYYLVKDNRLMARNTGLPLVYGADNSTTLYPLDGLPSVILPGNGFLNEEGKFRTQTFEFWTSIQNNAKESRKVFGPLTSLDGLYVDKHLLKLKVGSNEVSYSVGEWGRPMLVGIRLGKNNASVLINGTQVMTTPLDQSDFPPATEDWLGFYAYEDVPVVQIDCAAIYPYEVSSVLQKRRFVYGQGVEYPTSIKGLSHSSIVSFDHSVSGAAKNVRYPQTSPWSSGISNNLEANDTSLSLPNYLLPDLYSSSNGDWSSAMSTIFNSAEPSFTLKPNPDFAQADSFLYFENVSFLNHTPSAIFGVFEVDAFSSDPETLFEITRSIDLEPIARVILENNQIKYEGQILDGVEPVTLTENKFVAGFKLTDSSISSYNIYIGGSQNLSQTFSGNIYRVSFASTTDLDETFSGIFVNDIANPSSHADALSEYAMYSLVPRLSLGVFSLDIATKASWQDYMPLSYFAKSVIDLKNELYKSLDFLQFNIDYVKLENHLDGKYDTSGMPVKTYVAFEYLNNGVSPSRPNIQLLDKSGIVQPQDEWTTTRYEVLNDTIIKFPRGIDKFSLGMIVYIDVSSDGIRSNNVSIRHLDISSQSLGNQPNRISTQFGAKVIPYKRSGNYFEYKDVSPFSIGKESSPYLHLTKYSGIKPRVPYAYNSDQGISIPINTTKSSFFKADLFQFAMRYPENQFPIAPVQLFEIESQDSHIKFYLVADSNTQERGQLYAVDAKTATLRSDIVPFVNGKPVKRAIVNKNTWGMFSFSFLDAISFANYTGAFRITSPVLVDNLSFYQQSELDEVQRFAFRKWASVRSGIDTTFDWEYWKDSTWQEVLFLAESNAKLSDAESVYKTFTGTNSFIFDSSSTLVFNNYSSRAYKDLNWNSLTITPV